MTPSTAVLAAVYFLLATGMYYFDKQAFYLGVDVLYKMVFAAVIAALSILIFLVRTDLAKGGALMSRFWVLISPHLIVLTVSLPLWVFRMSSGSVVRRGLFAQLYCIGIILAVAGILYVFGRGGLWLNLAAMLAANLVTIVQLIARAGFGTYCRDLAALVRSFGRESGGVVASAEINELTLALGLYLIVMLLNWKQWKQYRFFWPMLALTCFCYLSGFKRIGVFAVILSVAVGLVLGKLTGGKLQRRGWLMAFSLVIIGGAFAYLFLVRAGFFELLEERFGINSMGRRDLTAFIEEYYFIGPGYPGQGAGFVSRLFSDRQGGEWVVRALHNDILAVYIDIGFWGFWLWMLAFVPLRVWTAAGKQGIRAGILCFCCCLYILVTAMTDNTIYYVYVIGTAAILNMNDSLKAEPKEGRQV